MVRQRDYTLDAVTEAAGRINREGQKMTEEEVVRNCLMRCREENNMIIQVIDTTSGNKKEVYQCKKAHYVPSFYYGSSGYVMIEDDDQEHIIFLGENDDLNVFYDSDDTLKNCAMVIYKISDICRDCCYKDITNITLRGRKMKFFAREYYVYTMDITPNVRKIYF